MSLTRLKQEDPLKQEALLKRYPYLFQSDIYKTVLDSIFVFEPQNSNVAFGIIAMAEKNKAKPFICFMILPESGKSVAVEETLRVEKVIEHISGYHVGLPSQFSSQESKGYANHVEFEVPWRHRHEFLKALVAYNYLPNTVYETLNTATAKNPASEIKESAQALVSVLTPTLMNPDPVASSVGNAPSAVHQRRLSRDG